MFTLVGVCGLDGEAQLGPMGQRTSNVSNATRRDPLVRGKCRRSPFAACASESCDGETGTLSTRTESSAGSPNNYRPRRTRCSSPSCWKALAVLWVAQFGADPLLFVIPVRALVSFSLGARSYALFPAMCADLLRQGKIRDRPILRLLIPPKGHGPCRHSRSRTCLAGLGRS